MQPDSIANTDVLGAELAWFSSVIDTCIKLYFCQECEYERIDHVEPPVLSEGMGAYADFVAGHSLGFNERLVLVLALVPHIQPYLLDIFFTQNANFNRTYTEFGGWKGQSHGGFLPTGETAAFILSGTNLAQRFLVQQIFSSEHLFAKKNVLSIKQISDGEPFLSGAVELSNEYLSLFTTGKQHKPDYTIHFPAKRITTPLEWSDLVLAGEVYEEIADVNTWIEHAGHIMEGMGMKKVLKPGYRVLFYGPPGTGKTLTASLIGKRNGLDVYRVDLSMVVSKYIGETEKNLGKIFDHAVHKNWILFFDEADALFGKRTSTNSSNDRHANQEVAYLLQKIEDFPGTVILATNLKSNIDEAFARRFQSVIYFPMPGTEERLQLWHNMFVGTCSLAPSVDFRSIAEKYKLSGGSITNIVRYCLLKQLQAQKPEIEQQDIIAGIVKELRKEGKTL